VKKDTDVFLKHIIYSIESIDNYTKDKSEQDFIESPETQDAAMRRLAVIGEAAKNIPSVLREKHKKIDWKAIIGLKNILVHEYFGVDIGVIWHIVKDDIPELKKEISKMLKEFV
jgi:uncharacterized protein with HEPN domain